MQRFFNSFSLRTKLLTLVSFASTALICSILLGLFIIHRVQIGGTLYRGIELKTEYIDNFARTRLNLNLINSILKSQIIDYDPDSLSGLSTTTEKIDAIISEMTTKMAAPEQGQTSCSSCHDLTRAPSVADSYKELSSSWLTMKEIISNEILPALERDETEEALDIFEEELFNHYYTLMTGSKKAVDQLRHGAQLMKKETIAEVQGFSLFYLVGGIATILIVLSSSFFFVQMTIRTINGIKKDLEQSADLIFNEAMSTAENSHTVAESASEMAASLEETSSALEEITSMTRQNDENSNTAHTTMQENARISSQASDKINAMQQSMEQIKQDSDAIASISNEIEGIAFQTNLLALNAAVEAARAGEAGAGFAVVAEEVRNLAQRTADSAKNSSLLVERALSNVDSGIKQVIDVVKVSSKMSEEAHKVGDLVAEIATASHEQSTGITEINHGVTQMDLSTQQLAANAEELAAAAETMNKQTQVLRRNITTLTQLLEGDKAQDHSEQKHPQIEQF